MASLPRMTRSTARALLLACGLLACVCAQAARQVGPIDRSGTLDGAPYRIVVPANWNGTLLVYLHGYRDKADHAGEIDNTNPDIAPSAALQAPLLAQGYALAGTAYRSNGWAVADGAADVRALASYFRKQVALPDRTLLWGFSLGSIIAFKAMEQTGGLFNGALCGCSIGAGATRSWDASGDLALAYDVVFGFPVSWGTFADVRNDVDFETDVQPKLAGEVSNVTNFPKFEFLRLVTGTPGRGISPPPPPNFYPGWVFTTMYYTLEARAELERRAGGPIVQNRDRHYSLSADEVAYLNGIGLPTAVIDGWLAAMNARRTASAPRAARNFVRNSGDYTGKLLNPVLTLHTLVDPVAPVSHQDAYAVTVFGQDREALLFQAYTGGNGHCNFTGPQLLTAVNAIDTWVRTGVAPTGATFPESLGFLVDFAPPPLLQP